MTLNRPIRAVTIEDVAELAGVSAKTVSRVLNNEPNVRPAKREVVLKASRELGYRPNPAARSLAGAKSFLIAHLHDNPVPEYIAAANDGIYNACRAKGYFLLPERVDPEAHDRLDRTRNFLLTARPDAVILTPPLCDDPDILDLLEQTATPFATLSSTRTDAAVAVLRHDEAEAAETLVKHLVDLGHRDIAMITGPDGHKAAAARADGYRRALSKSGITPDPDLIERGDYTMRSGLEAARRLLERDRLPSAIFAANDDMAVGALTAALARGLRVPEDISIAGYDDTRLAAAVWPPLTTIRQPVTDMARRAAERLMDTSLEGPKEETLDFELVVRASTGPARHD